MDAKTGLDLIVICSLPTLFSRGSHVTNPWTNLGGSVDLDPTGVRKFSDLDFNTE